MLKIVKVTVLMTFGECMIKEFIEEYLEHRDGSLWWKKSRSHCKSKEEAYKAYDVKAKELHKEFARTND